MRKHKTTRVITQMYKKCLWIRRQFRLTFAKGFFPVLMLELENYIFFNKCLKQINDFYILLNSAPFS